MKNAEEAEQLTKEDELNHYIHPYSCYIIGVVFIADL
jgi:hypothetical protein